ALRFVPEIWVDAAEWSSQNQVMQNNQDTGLEFLTLGVAANPESVQLAVKHADRMESPYPGGECDDATRELAAAVREPYNLVLDRLYEMCKDLKEKEQSDVERTEQAFAAMASNRARDGYDDEDDGAASAAETEKANRIKAIKQ